MLKAVFFCLLVFSALFVGLASCQEPTPTPSPSPSPTPTPTPTPYQNAIITPFSVQSINPAGVPLTFSTYNRTVVTLSYAVANNYTLSVFAYDPSHYENSGPETMNFIATGVATYILHFQVLYDSTLNQTVTLTIQSGDGKETIVPIACVNDGFTLDVTVITSVLPRVPTAQELWDYGNSQQQQFIENQTKRYEASQFQDSIFRYAVVGSVIVIVILVALVLRHQRHQDQRIDTLNAYGFGYPRDKH